MAKWMDIAGQLFALIGVIVLAFGFIISRKQAVKIGISRLAESHDARNRCLPHVRDRMRQAKAARTGVLLLAIGFILQIVSAFLD